LGGAVCLWRGRQPENPFYRFQAAL